MIRALCIVPSRALALIARADGVLTLVGISHRCFRSLAELATTVLILFATTTNIPSYANYTILKTFKGLFAFLVAGIIATRMDVLSC